MHDSIFLNIGSRKRCKSVEDILSGAALKNHDMTDEEIEETIAIVEHLLKQLIPIAEKGIETKEDVMMVGAAKMWIQIRSMFNT